MKALEVVALGAAVTELVLLDDVNVVGFAESSR
jgi:hypothetical protein